MIPRHRPPFGLLSLAGSLLRSAGTGTSIEDLQQWVEQRLGVRHAVWLPSARYGITQAAKFCLSSEGRVYCPTFNCGAVHHAAQETQRPVTYVDCQPGSFLMDCRLPQASERAVILSEMFGERFSSAQLNQPGIAEARMRIFDLAMGIPQAADTARMQADDVTVLSFGLGKSLFAGWGGMALTNSDDLAEWLRERVQGDLKRGSIRNQLRWHVSLMARVAAHNPLVYSAIRRRSEKSGAGAAQFSQATHEWHRPATALHLARCRQNFSQMSCWSKKRRLLAEQYMTRLVPFQDRLQLPRAADAYSHFSIRVSAVQRDFVRSELWDAGIDAGTLFPFPGHLCSEQQFPNAAAAAAEILNLPMSVDLSATDVNRVCDVLRSVLSRVDSFQQPIARAA